MISEKRAENILNFSSNKKNVLTNFTFQNNQTHVKTNHCTNKPRIISNYEEKRVNDYLIKNGISTTLDISTALNLYVYDTVQILQKLESKGIVLKAKQG